MPRLIDLSGEVASGQPTYPGNQSTQFWVSGTHEESAMAGLRRVKDETPSIRRKLKAQREGDDEEEHPIARTVLVSEHGPTHIDSLTHVDPTSDGSIDRLPLERFYGDAVGVDVSHVGEGFITVEDVRSSLDDYGLEIQEGDAITLYTGHREEHYGHDVEQRLTYFQDAPGLDREAAYWLGEQGVSNVGIDGPSIDHGSALETQRYPAHDMCAEYEVLNTENMANLESVAGLRYTLCAFPLKLEDGTGSPIRPVAIVEE